MAGLDGQSGFTNPYNQVNTWQNNKATDAPAIRKAATTIQTPSPESSKKLDKEKEVVEKEIFQTREEATQVQEEVLRNRAAVDEFSSKDQIKQAKTLQGSTAINSKVAKQVNEEKDKQETVAEKINQMQLGIGVNRSNKANPLELVKDNQTTQETQEKALESLDPDARAAKDLNKKLKTISERGGAKGKDFIDFVERRKNDKGIVPENIMDLVNGFLETLKGASLTPSEQLLAGQEPIISLRDKYAADNIDEQNAFNKSLFQSYGASAGELKAIAYVSRIKNQSGELRSPPPPAMDYSKASSQELAIEFIQSINMTSLPTPWDIAA